MGRYGASVMRKSTTKSTIQFDPLLLKFSMDDINSLAIPSMLMLAVSDRMSGDVRKRCRLLKLTVGRGAIELHVHRGVEFDGRVSLHGAVEHLTDVVRVVEYKLLNVNVARVGCKTMCFYCAIQSISPDATSCAT